MTIKNTFPVLTLISVFLLFTFGQCGKLDTTEDVPSCIKKKITAIRSADVRNPSASVWQAEYNGQTVYYFPPYCCDFPGELFDSNCNLICNPDGGFSGAGDGKCADYFSKRTNAKMIWKDDR